MLSLTCPRCHAVITADDEENLVARVQAHVRDDHGGGHVPSRKHILALLHRQDTGPGRRHQSERGRRAGDG